MGSGFVQKRSRGRSARKTEKKVFVARRIFLLFFSWTFGSLGCACTSFAAPAAAADFAPCGAQCPTSPSRVSLTHSVHRPFFACVCVPQVGPAAAAPYGDGFSSITIRHPI